MIVGREDVEPIESDDELDEFLATTYAARRTDIAVVEIRDHVKWLKRTVQALLTHQGLTVE